MDAFWRRFELCQSFIRFRDAPQFHRPPQNPTMFCRAIFADQSVDAGKAFRPIRAVDHHHAPAYLGPRAALCPRLHSAADPLRAYWLCNSRLASVP